LTYLPYNISETMRMRFDENAGFLLWFKCALN
jgi:hypothetical protein